MNDDDEVECGSCGETTYSDEAKDDGWLSEIELNDGTEWSMYLCPSCAVRYLDVDDRMPIKTYETIRKIQTTI